MDFGCGSGGLVGELTSLGFDAVGCDVFDPKDSSQRLKQITQSPYRFPFPDASFDVVTSTSVLEHAQNPEEYMAEISRVLKPGGIAMHLLPGKWYLPTEPHIFVPLVNFFWPRCPDWWFYLWAFLGCRNDFQANMPWTEVAKVNIAYSKTGIIYLRSSEYERLSRRYFSRFEWPMQFFIEHAHGGFASLARRLPFPALWGILSRECRMGFLVQHKLSPD